MKGEITNLVDDFKHHRSEAQVDKQLVSLSEQWSHLNNQAFNKEMNSVESAMIQNNILPDLNIHVAGETAGKNGLVLSVGDLDKGNRSQEVVVLGADGQYYEAKGRMVEDAHHHKHKVYDLDKQHKIGSLDDLLTELHHEESHGLHLKKHEHHPQPDGGAHHGKTEHQQEGGTHHHRNTKHQGEGAPKHHGQPEHDRHHFKPEDAKALAKTLGHLDPKRGDMDEAVFVDAVIKNTKDMDATTRDKYLTELQADMDRDNDGNPHARLVLGKDDGHIDSMRLVVSKHRSADITDAERREDSTSPYSPEDGTVEATPS